MSSAGARYDSIGRSYAGTRQPDPRIAAALRTALGQVESVINIGAGAGSYEPTDVDVLAVDPSATMLAQRPDGAPPAVIGTAEKLPVSDQSFDASLAILTIHHWPDRAAAFAEIRRVVRRRAVFFTFVWGAGVDFWLLEYFPGITSIDAKSLPSLDEFESLGPSTVTEVPVPHDCTDGFLGAYWRRPAAYLDPSVRANISALALLPPTEVEAGVARLASDLDTGRWHERHGAVMNRTELDLGYRIVTVELERVACSRAIR